MQSMNEYRGFVVESDAWWNADIKIVELTRVFRQKDANFIARLNRMRKGQSDWEDVNWMNKNFFEPYKGQPLLSPPGTLAASPLSVTSASSVAKGQEEPAPDPDPLHLYAKNKKVRRFAKRIRIASLHRPADLFVLHLVTTTHAQVDARNEEKMRRLRDKGNIIDAYDFIWHVKEGIFGRRDPPFCMEKKYAAGVQQLQDNALFYNRLLAAARLELKVGAKVILLKNLDQVAEQRLVNGSIGTIIRWASTPKEVKYDSLPATNGQMGGHASKQDQPSKEERHSLVKHTEDYIQQWLKKNSTKVPIVRGALIR